MLVRYVDNKFSLATKSTIGADFLSKQIEVDDQAVTLQVRLPQPFSFHLTLLSYFRYFSPFLLLLLTPLPDLGHGWTGAVCFSPYSRSPLLDPLIFLTLVRFQGLGTTFYRGSDGAIFVFDVSRKNTFDALLQWKKAFLIQVRN